DVTSQGLESFTCSVCLDTLTDPVTIPCGHSFCLKCLTDCWDQSQEPELNRNTLLNEVMKKIKKTALRPQPSQKYASPGDVECDFCTGMKIRVLKSCLTCMASYCQTHLQPHYEVAALKHHKLVDPDRNLKEKLCAKHQKSMEMFCKTDETCICLMCGMTEHDGHEKVELETEREGKQVSGVYLFTFTCLLTHRIKLLIPVTHSQISSLVFFSLLSDFCPLTMDINTTHRDLRLSEGNKKVTCEGTVTEYPDHPDRFAYWAQVLCREALIGTRCYWEMECSGHNMAIGVTYKGLNRKGRGVECIVGNNDKSWSLWCFNSQYSALHNYKQTVISAPYIPRIGVYLDWPAGSLSFYSVSHTMTLLHRFNTSFTEPLYPGFCLDLHCSVTISHLTLCDH
uniref:Uncharacterized protein n=1 Tax=Erpetoichthys calabaricus TaxID=27687 RepID=A0A8C4STN0_ERPCA